MQSVTKSGSKNMCLTSVSAVCRGQAQAAVQVADGRQQALCFCRLQPPCYVTH